VATASAANPPVRAVDPTPAPLKEDSSGAALEAFLPAPLGSPGTNGTGLDTVPLPGDVTERELARIIGDVALLAWKWQKPLTARLPPVHGRKAGEMSEFDDPFVVNARLQALP
jgi:uncharacterized protein (UPF0210 family)